REKAGLGVEQEPPRSLARAEGNRVVRNSLVDDVGLAAQIAGAERGQQSLLRRQGHPLARFEDRRAAGGKPPVAVLARRGAVGHDRAERVLLVRRGGRSRLSPTSPRRLADLRGLLDLRNPGALRALRRLEQVGVTD